MALSTASALRPLRAIERVTFPGVNPEVARISVGMIGEVPFELLVEPEGLELYALIGDNDILNYMLITADHPGGPPAAARALRLLDEINRGCQGLDALMQRHHLELLEMHRVERRGRCSASASLERVPVRH
jgi:hypothetical protein